MRGRHHTAIGGAGLALMAVLAAVAAMWPRRPPAEIAGPARADVSGTPAVAVADVQLGRSVGLDKRIADPADAFGSDDAIYASVVTEGAAEHVRLTARWSHDGRVVAEVSQAIGPWEPPSASSTSGSRAAGPRASTRCRYWWTRCPPRHGVSPCVENVTTP